MKKTQKLRATVEDISFDTTFEKLPQQFLGLAQKLEAAPDMMAAFEVVITSGNASLFIQLEYVGAKPKVKKKVESIFGYDTEEFMSKQYR